MSCLSPARCAPLHGGLTRLSITRDARCPRRSRRPRSALIRRAPGLGREPQEGYAPQRGELQPTSRVAPSRPGHALPRVRARQEMPCCPRLRCSATGSERFQAPYQLVSQGAPRRGGELGAHQGVRRTAGLAPAVDGERPRMHPPPAHPAATFGSLSCTALDGALEERWPRGERASLYHKSCVYELSPCLWRPCICDGIPTWRSQRCASALRPEKRPIERYSLVVSYAFL